MPHQWMEGNLPVSAKCAVCDKTCGSVLRLQDWRCLWCRATVHTQCRPNLSPSCPLGPARVSVVPPTALHSIQDEAWEAVRPQASSPLLVFVNSKSGDNQGVKFLRRFKQLLNPAQVFDLISTGPRLGLRLFRHFDPFRILVCSGDGSVGWVLSEIDKLDMHFFTSLFCPFLNTTVLECPRIAKNEKVFWDYVAKFDVVGLVETWVQRENWEKFEETLPQEYVWECPGATNEKKKGGASGGIVMGIRKEMQELEKGSNNKSGIMKKVIQLDNNRWEIIIVYIKKMEETKINIEKETKEKGDEKILLEGDFNARLGDKEARIIDKEKGEKRGSKDKANNKEGKILWKIIEEMGWEILNGNKEGKWTYIGARGESIIDYGIVNEEAWDEIESFKVGERKQCQVAVLPLGTGNDLARVLGWGSSCDDDTHLPQLLEKYEKAGTKMLDRWSIMAFERTIAMPKLSLTPGQPDGQLHNQITQYEDSLVTHLQNILQSDETSVILNSAKRLCETVKEFATQVSESSITRGDEQLGKKCDILQQKLDLLLATLTSEQLDAANLEDAKTKQEDTDSEVSFDRGKTEKSEKDLSNFNFRKHRRTSRFMEREKDALMLRANSLKRAIRNLVEHTEQVVDEQNRQESSSIPTVKISLSTDLDKEELEPPKVDSLKLPTIESGSSTDVSSCPSPTSSILTARLANISPMPDVRRDSTIEDPDLLTTLPVPPDFADSRRSSHVQPSAEADAATEKILRDTCSTLMSIGSLKTNEHEVEIHQERQRRESTKCEERRESTKCEERRDSTKCEERRESTKYEEEEKECSSILSAISNEEVSITSEILDQKSFCPRKNSDGEDLNGHIYHIDSPETDTYPNSDALHGESLMDDLSSMLGEVMYGYDQDSIENTYTDDTTLFTSEMAEIKLERRMSAKRESLEKKRRSSRSKVDEDTQFGFENRAFMSQHVYLDNKLETEPTRYCSLAHFVEGNDIARKSFKRPRTTTKISKTEANVNRQSTLLEENEITPIGSCSNLNKLEKELSNVSTSTLKALDLLPDERKQEEESPTDTDIDKPKPETCIFPQVSVIVEPPSPVLTEDIRVERMVKLGVEIEIDSGSDFDLRNLCSKAEKLSTSDITTSNNSSSSNLLGIDNEHFLTRSPAATRRISCCSMLNPAEAAALAAAAAATNFYTEAAEKKEKEKKDAREKDSRKLPIINPLVTLPTWPNVSTGSGFISKCLLANADTLCAAVSPLIDPDETLLEGFYERCVMNNYFGIGIDAKISLDFHHKREEHPEKCRSRAKNYMWYGVLGSKQWLQKTYKNLEQRVQLECDGQRIPLPSLQGIVILNIPR
ncbi:hypothetical protein Zmor_015296 [Zophobas morio]|uniref:Diacylglycerol kinase n=1 Tax=Zophobas morio TaxID=2755281 RepID=A0AA38IHR3_9CUCU|nr:hypothetical protein Zmor_015296 [Zophobas morio]